MVKKDGSNGVRWNSVINRMDIDLQRKALTMKILLCLMMLYHIRRKASSKIAQYMWVMEKKKTEQDLLQIVKVLLRGKLFKLMRDRQP